MVVRASFFHRRPDYATTIGRVTTGSLRGPSSFPGRSRSREATKVAFSVNFMFQLTAEEFEGLWSQNATTKKGRGGCRDQPPRAAKRVTGRLEQDLATLVERAAANSGVAEVLALHRVYQAKLSEIQSRLGRRPTTNTLTSDSTASAPR